MSNKNATWYVIYTKPRWEKKVADSLTRKQIENYCPLNRVQRQWSDRKKIVQEPLFVSYVFVRITEDMQSAVRMTDGVINYVYWLGKPAIVKNEEIDIIKRFLNEHENVITQKCEVSVRDTVRIINGTFLFEEGSVMEVLNNSVKVILPSLGYSLIAEVKKTNIEVIRKSGYSSLAAKKSKFP